MVRLRTATGNIGWVDVSAREAEALPATGQWLRADALDYSRTKHGEVPAVVVALPPVAVAVESEPAVDAKRGPGRPRKAA